ncbi:MAG: heme o synthase [Candidatus Hodarchaeota archaeon]
MNLIPNETYGELSVQIANIFQNYLTIMKPRVVILLVLSAIAAFVSGELMLEVDAIRWQRLLLVIVTGAFSSGGANAINSWFERDTDALMPRTKQRPLPLGLILPSQAFFFGIFSIFLGVVLAFLFLNSLSALMILLGALWYSVGYTMLLKRRTKWNIIGGGLAGVFPVLAGWSAAYGSMDAVFPWALGFLVWIWIPLHFWALAIRFREEYAAVSIPMLPVVVGSQRTIPFITSSALILLLAVLGIAVMQETHFLFILGSIPLVSWMLKHTLTLIRNPSPENSWKLFKVSNFFLLLIEALIILDSVCQIYFSLEPLVIF